MSFPPSRESADVVLDYRLIKWKDADSSTIIESGDCELQVINNMDEQVILCWVDQNLVLHHFYIINDRSIKDGSVSNIHEEFTKAGDSFVCFRRTKKGLPATLQDVDPESLLFHVRLKKPFVRTIINLKVGGKGSMPFFRRKNKCQVIWSCEELRHEPVIDTSHKNYEELFVHGFRLLCEQNVFVDFPELYNCLDQDLGKVCDLLPSEAKKLLQSSTPFYLNKTLIYGRVSSPITSSSVCFHPIGGKEWLIKHGLSGAKEGSIEVGSVQDYISSRTLWGRGGLFLHELSHAFHNKFCENGYDCSEIQEAFERAMNRKLYDCVPVRGRQGKDGPVKAYACSNCMEFFAELSVAFLYLDDETTEYNKWYPFNRKQLQAHDPETCEVLNRIWMQHEQ